MALPMVLKPIPVNSLTRKIPELILTTLIQTAMVTLMAVKLLAAPTLMMKIVKGLFQHHSYIWILNQKPLISVKMDTMVKWMVM